MSEACLGPYDDRDRDSEDELAEEIAMWSSDFSLILEAKQDIFHLHAGVMIFIYAITSPRRYNILQDNNRDIRCQEMLRWLIWCHDSTKSAMDRWDTSEDGHMVNTLLLEDERLAHEIKCQYRNQNFYQWAAAGNFNFLLYEQYTRQEMLDEE